VGHVDSRFGWFEDNVSTGARECMVCAKSTIGLEIVFYASNATVDDKAQLEARFGPFGDSANHAAR
jgi:hypothetical protein